MFLKYQHPKIDDQFLYFLKTDSHQTTPVDLTSFILDRIDKNKDISEFIKNFETLGIENDIPSYFQNYMSIADVELTSRVLAPIARRIETFIENCNNFDLDNLRNELIIYINQLNEDEIVKVLFSNRLIWNYLNNENKSINKLQSYVYINLIEERKKILHKRGVFKENFKSGIFDGAMNDISIYDENEKNVGKFNELKKINKKIIENKDFFILEDNHIYLEIDHKEKNVWLYKKIWDFWNHSLMQDNNTLTEFIMPMYFLSDEKIFKPIWFRAMGYTIKPTGDYAKTYWKIIEKQIN
jgi:hypothetical protein